MSAPLIKKLFFRTLLFALFFISGIISRSTAQNAIQQGFDLLKDKKYREAYDKLNEAIKKFPDSARSYRGRGEIDYSFFKDTAGALVDYNKAIDLNPNFGLAYRNRGVVYGWMKEYKKAISDFDKSLVLLPAFGKTYCDRAFCKFFLYDYVGAVQDFNKAIELVPDFAQAYMGRGRAENNMELYELAIQDMDKAVQLDPKLEPNYNNIIQSSPELQRLKGNCSIYMTKDRGVYMIHAEIDDVPTDFIFDTGAAGISISAIEEAYLRGKGVLTDADYLGNVQMSDATGKVTTDKLILIRKVKLGCKELTNVKATIVPTMDAPFLMGQSALSQFGKISIDYKKLTISFGN